MPLTIKYGTSCHYWHREFKSSTQREILVSSLAASCRCRHRLQHQLRPLLRCLSEDAAKTLIQAFINTQLDYCNSLYDMIIADRLQSVQNAAARLTGLRSGGASESYWLPVRRRVEFKLSTLVYRSLTGTVLLLT